MAARARLPISASAPSASTAIWSPRKASPRSTPWSLSCARSSPGRSRPPTGSASPRISRDLRYWNARRETAELSVPEPGSTVVRFGMTVTIEAEDGSRRSWKIVGEDEADAASGSVSHVSPMALALFGKRVGDARGGQRQGMGDRGRLGGFLTPRVTAFPGACPAAFPRPPVSPCRAGKSRRPRPSARPRGPAAG